MKSIMPFVPINHCLRTKGYDKCADQSVIAETLNAATKVTVEQLETALDEIWAENNLSSLLIDSSPTPEKSVRIDIDLSSLPASKAADQSKKGYAAKKKNQYGRQLARVIVSRTSEIVTQSVYSGNTISCVTFKEMIKKTEQTLQLTTQQKRQSVRLRLDAGFGTDENINFALWRGYGVLVKMYSGKRATKLAKSVSHWEEIPSAKDNTKSRSTGTNTK